MFKYCEQFKNIILKIIVVNKFYYIIIFLKILLVIIYICSNKSLFNISRDVFNKKRITNIFCNKL